MSLIIMLLFFILPKLIVGATKSFIHGKSLSTEGHTHDDRYFTEVEMNSLLSGKANTSHSHDASHIISGVLPLMRGGTGVTTVDALKTLLGISSGGSLIMVTKRENNSSGYSDAYGAAVNPMEYISAKLLTTNKAIMYPISFYSDSVSVRETTENGFGGSVTEHFVVFGLQS